MTICTNKTYRFYGRKGWWRHRRALLNDSSYDTLCVYVCVCMGGEHLWSSSSHLCPCGSRPRWSTVLFQYSCIEYCQVLLKIIVELLSTITRVRAEVYAHVTVVISINRAGYGGYQYQLELSDWKGEREKVRVTSLTDGWPLVLDTQHPAHLIAFQLFARLNQSINQ
jgi:hypothetical protein